MFKIIQFLKESLQKLSFVLVIHQQVTFRNYSAVFRSDILSFVLHLSTLTQDVRDRYKDWIENKVKNILKFKGKKTVDQDQFKLTQNKK